MKYYIPLLIFLTIILVLMANQCPKEADKAIQTKIAFDYSAIDEGGLRRGEAAVDYEFCIPAVEELLSEIRKIAPDIRVLPKSKGRVGCQEGQWLLIHTTREKKWKEVLYAIAAKPYVEKIIETYYE